MKKKTSVLLITSNFFPEPTGIAVYSTDLASLLIESGFSVTILTGIPHYPWWKIPDNFSYRGGEIDSFKGSVLLRSKHYVPKESNIFSRARFEKSLFFNMNSQSRNLLGKHFDVVIGYIPSIASGIVSHRISRKLRIPLGIVIQDLSGIGIKQSGLHGGHFISRIVEALELRIIRDAKSVVPISQSMKEVLLARAVEKDQINLIYNYSARTIQRANKLKMKAVFGWSESDFIVLHTGNIGNKQNLENLVLAASLLEESSNIKIFLVGHGNQESKIRNMCFGKSNIFVIPSVSDSKYSQLLSAADLLIINERITQLDMSLPSKLTSYFYSERPVIAAVPRGGATWKFLDGIAELVEAGKPSLLADAIKALSQDPVKRKDLASKGLKFAKKNLDAEIGRTKYLDWVNSLIQSKRG